MNAVSQVVQNLSNYFEICELSGKLRSENSEKWAALWEALPFQLTCLSPSMIDYQHAYLRSAGKEVLDLSLVLLHDHVPCAIWPLTLTVGSTINLTSLGKEIQPPYFVPGLSARTEKKIVANAIKLVRLLQASIAIPNIYLEEFHLPILPAVGLSEWHQQWMSAGAIANVKHDLYIDLSLTTEQIHANIRKSYRPLIEKGCKLWDVAHFDQNNINHHIWFEFKELHKEVAGRVTRNEETWSLQYQMILNGDGFFIALRDKEDRRLIGGAFFQTTRDEGLYSIAAYDRNLFDKPVGHVVQMYAIQLMKKMGLKWYKLGERFFPSDKPEPSKKELSISSFKQGFATHLLPRLCLTMISMVDGLEHFLK